MERRVRTCARSWERHVEAGEDSAQPVSVVGELRGEFKDGVGSTLIQVCANARDSDV